MPPSVQWSSRRPWRSKDSENDNFAFLALGSVVGCMALLLCGGIVAIGYGLWSAQSSPAPAPVNPAQPVAQGQQPPNQGNPPDVGNNNQAPQQPVKDKIEQPGQKKEPAVVPKKEPPKEQPFKLYDVKLPGPAAVGQTIEVGRYKISGLDVTLLNGAAEKDNLVGDVLWTPQGDAFFALTKDGSLSRVAYKGFVLEKQVVLGKRCTALALSKQGLLASLAEPQEVLLIDPVSLSVNQRMPIKGVKRVTASPALDVGFALCEDSAIALDLVKGSPVRFLKGPTRFGRLTPDGKYYFAESSENLACFRVDGSKLIAYQSSTRIAQNGQSICVSPDSKYVCLPSGGGNYGTSYGTFVYAVDNLKQPAFTLKSGAFPQLVGFDPVSGLVFAQRQGVQFLVFDKSAALLKEYNLSADQNHGDEARQFVPHPAGRKMLLVTENRLLFVEFEAILAGAPNGDALPLPALARWPNPALEFVRSHG
jgi:hypothetical protein